MPRTVTMASGPVKVREIQPYGYQNYNLNIASNLNILSGNLSISENLNIGTNLTITEHLAIGASGDNTEHDLFVNGNIGLNNDGYIYYNTGTDIGLRENSGIMEVKFRSGSWDPISGVSSGIWEKTGSKIYYNTDNVGFKTINPQSKVEVFGNLSVSGNVIITDTTDSVNSLTGAIRIPGGVGVQRDIVIGEDLKISDIAKLDGGADINATVSISDGVVISNTSESSNLSTGALISQGGLAAQKKLIVSGNSIFSSHINISESANISQQLVCSNFTEGYANIDYINAPVASTSIIGMDSLVGNISNGTTGITLNSSKIMQGYSFNTASQVSWASNISAGTNITYNEVHNLFNQDDISKWVLDENMLGYNEYSAINYDGTTAKAIKQTHIIVPVKSSVSLSSDNKIKITAASDYTSSALNKPPSSFQLWGIKKSGAAEPTINPPYVCPGNESVQRAEPVRGYEIYYEDRFYIFRDCSKNNNNEYRNNHAYNRRRSDGYGGDFFHSSQKANHENNSENNCIKNKIYDAININDRSTNGYNVTTTNAVKTVFMVFINYTTDDFYFIDFRSGSNVYLTAGIGGNDGINDLKINGASFDNSTTAIHNEQNTIRIMSFTCINNSSTSLRLFEKYNDGDAFKGSIIEILMYDQVLNSTDIGNITTYLNTKYGIYNSGSITSLSPKDLTQNISGVTITTSSAELQAHYDASNLYANRYWYTPEALDAGQDNRNEMRCTVGILQYTNTIKPLRHKDSNAWIWCYGIEDRAESDGIYLKPGDKYCIRADASRYSSRENLSSPLVYKVPARYEIYGCTSKDINVDFATVINDKYEFSGNANNLIKLADAEKVFRDYKWFEQNKESSRNGVYGTYNNPDGTFTGNTQFYWLIIVVYGLNRVSDIPYELNTTMNFNSFGSEMRNPSGVLYNNNSYSGASWNSYSSANSSVYINQRLHQINYEQQDASTTIFNNRNNSNASTSIELTTTLWGEQKNSYVFYLKNQEIITSEATANNIVSVPEDFIQQDYELNLHIWRDLSGNNNDGTTSHSNYDPGQYKQMAGNNKLYNYWDFKRNGLIFKTLSSPVKTIFIVFLISHKTNTRGYLFDCREKDTATNQQTLVNEVWLSANKDHNKNVSLSDNSTSIWSDSNSILINGTTHNRITTSIDEETMPGANILSCTCSDNTSTDFKLGAQYDGSDNNFADGMMEVLCYDTVLSPLDISDITDYLNEKWGVYGTYENTPLNLTLGVPTPTAPSTSSNLIIHLDSSNISNFKHDYIPGDENANAFNGFVVGKVLNLNSTEEIRDINKPAFIWGFPLGGRSSYNTISEAINSGYYIYPGDKFAFQVDYQNKLNDAPSKFEIYGCTSKDTIINFSNVNNGRYEFTSPGSNFLKLASWDSKEIIKWNELDEENYRIDQHRSSIVRSYNETFSGQMFYWLIIVIYGVNTFEELANNSVCIFRYFSSEVRSSDGKRYKFSSNNNDELEGVDLIDWPHYSGAMEAYGPYTMLREWMTPPYYHIIDDPSSIQINNSNGSSTPSLLSNNDTTINLTTDLWLPNTYTDWKGNTSTKNYVFMLGLVNSKLVTSINSDIDTGPLNQSEPKDVGSTCSIELLHSLLDTTDITNSNGNELTNSSYVNGIYSTELNQSFTAQVYDYLYLIVYTTTHDGTAGYSKLSFANLDIEEQSQLPAIGLEVTNDINITNTLTNTKFNVTDSSTVNRNLTANQLSVSKNCNVGGNIVITGNATFEDSLIVQGPNTLSVEGKSNYNDDFIILGENKLVSSNTSSNKTIFSDGVDLILTSGVDINLNASQNINLDTNKKMLFGPQIELVGDNVNNFNITTPQDINLIPSAGYNVNIGENVGISFKSDTQQLIVDGVNNFNMVTAADINLTPASNQNINLDNNIGLSFTQTVDTQQIVSSSGYLSINSSKDVNLTPSTGYNVNIPTDINITFGSDTEKINADSSNNLNINADKDINITPGSQYNINIPQNKGLIFGADTQSLISDGENNFNINAGGDINFELSSTNNLNIENNIGLTFGEDTQKIEANNDNELTITSGADINLTPAADKYINIPSNIKLTFGSDTQRIDANNDNELTFTTAGDINLTPVSGYNVNIPVNTGIMFGSDTQKINSDAAGDLYIRGDGTLNIANDTITVFNNDTQSTIGGDGSLKVFGGMYIQEDCSVKENLIIVGNKNITGDAIMLDAEQVVIDDPLIIIGANSTSSNDNHILGFVGRYGKQGAGNNEYRFTGLVRDSVEKEFGLLSNIEQTGNDIELPNISDSDFKNNNKLGDLNIGKLINEDTTNATDYNVGASVITGSIGVEKDIFIQTNKHIKYGNTGRYITADNTDLNLISGSDINLTATNDINILSNIGLTFNSDDTKIESDGSELTIQTTKDINLTSGTGYNVNIPQDIGLSFKGDTQNILSNSSDELVIRSKENIKFIPESGQDINIPQDIGLTFKNDNQKIEADTYNDITITSGRNIVLSSTQDINLTPATGFHVNIPQNNSLSVGADTEYITGDGDINIHSSQDINLIPAANKDINIPQDIGLTFGADTQKLEGDNVNNFNITAANDINLTPTVNVNIPTNKKLTFGADTQNLIGDNVNNFNINSGGDILLTPEAGQNINIPSLINLTFGGDTQKIFNGNEYGAINFDFTDSSSNKGSYSVSPTYNGDMSSTPSADGIEFENAGDYVSLGTHDFNAPLSISCWIKIHSAGHGTNYGRIFTIHDPISTRGLHMLCNNDELTFGLYNGNPAIGGYNWYNNRDTWIHVVGVLESDNSLKLYVDNYLISSGATQTYDFNQTFTGVFIGASIQGFETVHNFDGEMHSFAIFNKALSVGEINYLYNSGTKATQALPSNFKIHSGADINLTPAATKDVNIPDSIHLTFGVDDQSIVNNSSDLNMNAACDINLTPATNQDINLEQDIAITFGTDTQNIKGDSNDNITINSGKNLILTSTEDINLTPATDKNVNIPANIGMSFGSDTENIMADSSNNLTIKCDEDINLTPASNKDINIPTDINLVFNTTEKMIGDNVNNFNINAAQDINLTPASGYNVNIPSEIGLTFGSDDQKIEADSNSNLVITAEKDISLIPASGYNINIPANVGVSFGDKHMLTYESEGGNNFNIVTSGDLNLQPSQNYNINIPRNIGVTFSADTQNLISDNVNNFNINSGADIFLTPSTGYNVNIPQDISLTFGSDTERLDADSSDNLNILSSENINLTPAAGQNINIEQDTSVIFGSNNSEKITANSNDELTINADEDINLIPASNQDINIPNEIGLVFGSNDSEKIEVDATTNLTIQANNDIIFDTNNATFNINSSISGNIIVTDNFITTGETDLQTTTNLENALNVKHTMVLVPDTVDIVGALGAGVPEQILTSNSLTIIKASGNMTADAKFALADGSYNGQVKKICLHPSYNLTTSVNYSHEVLIDIDNFYDPDGNPASSSAAATLVLNKGGQTLNILWIKNGASGVGYWVLMDSNFDLI